VQARQFYPSVACSDPEHTGASLSRPLLWVLPRCHNGGPQPLTINPCCACACHNRAHSGACAATVLLLLLLLRILFPQYGERVGATVVISSDADAAKRVLSQMKKIARAIWSNPPMHGAKIAAEVWGGHVESGVPEAAAPGGCEQGASAATLNFLLTPKP